MYKQAIEIEWVITRSKDKVQSWEGGMCFKSSFTSLFFSALPPHDVELLKSTPLIKMEACLQQVFADIAPLKSW